MKEGKGDISKHPKLLLEKFYSTMTKIRFFETKVEEKFLAGEIPGFVHLYIGEEAIAAGVMAHLGKDDYIQSTHRGHGHTIAKGADLKRMMAEIFGKRSGCCKGKGGSMHIADFSVGMLGANGVVGGGYTLATGAALATKMQGKDSVSVVFFGDGASNRGTFHEAANMAAVWGLPVIFVCENNQFASTTPYRTTTSVADIADRAAGYGMPGVIVDGNDVFAVYEAAGKLIEKARKGEGPAILECKTYRIKGHFVGDPERYRTREEVQKVCESDDPLERFMCAVSEKGLLSEKEMDEILSRSRLEVEEALSYAQNEPEPEPSELFSDVYA
jgi:acetoin:2,6-dichlorophenolindophenol oxidoreductase subunit alpha